jgi:hypothetical protein
MESTRQVRARLALNFSIVSEFEIKRVRNYLKSLKNFLMTRFV